MKRQNQAIAEKLADEMYYQFLKKIIDKATVPVWQRKRNVR